VKGINTDVSSICFNWPFIDDLASHLAPVVHLITINSTSIEEQCCCLIWKTDGARSTRYARHRRMKGEIEKLNVGCAGKLQRTDTACGHQWCTCFIGTNYNITNFAEYGSTSRLNNFVLVQEWLDLLQRHWQNCCQPNCTMGTASVRVPPSRFFWHWITGFLYFVHCPVEGLIYILKMVCRNIWNFPTNVFFQFFSWRVIAVNSVVQTAPEEKIRKD
jgi:hypothetical protein